MSNSPITVTERGLLGFRAQLLLDEKSAATVEKYMRDCAAFARFLGGRAITKQLVIDYKRRLDEAGYAVGSVNSMLVSVNRLLAFLGLSEYRVRQHKTQQRIYSPAERELTRAEYERLLHAAEGNRRLHLLLQTICATGIRVSELQFFTVEAVKSGEVPVACKGKQRCILLPGKLRRLLLSYASSLKIQRGVIFRTRSGRALNRSNIWAEMKRLCARAKVDPGKVFPHNLRKLFARTFYRLERDIAKLADILGHSSINTTRIYIMSTGAEHRKCIERLRLC